jgi:RNA polymerase sigma factor for flagellar operon FliA
MPTTNVVNIASGSHRARFEARRNALVEAHMSLAAGVAAAIARNLPAAFEREDLTAEAYAALIVAANSYRPGAQIPFSAWARLKVRGAVLDAVRRRWCDDGSQSANPRRGFTSRAGSNKHALRPLAVAIDDDRRPDPAPDAAVALDAARLRVRVAKAISTLPAAEVEVLEARYGSGEETFAQIGARLAMKRKRVAALHASAIAGLRRELRAA